MYSIKSFIYCLFIASFFFTSCSQLLVEPDPKGDAEKNFEIFWNDLYTTYPFFEIDKIDWQQTYKTYRPQVTGNTTNDQLFAVFQEMLSPLSDGHLSIKNTNGDTWATQRQGANNIAISYPIIYNTYLQRQVNFVTSPDPSDAARLDTVAVHGIINNNYLYVWLLTFYTNYNYDRLIDSLNRAYPANKGLVLDVRLNGGGNLSTMWKLFGMFGSQSLNYATNKQKVGPLADNFGDPNTFKISPNALQYTKEVALLTNNYSASASEHAALIARAVPNITSIGETTTGAMSPIVQRTLPNGMGYTTVTSITLDVNGNLYENIGVPPEIPVAFNAQNPQNFRDPIIDRAIQEMQ